VQQGIERSALARGGSRFYGTAETTSPSKAVGGGHSGREDMRRVVSGRFQSRLGDYVFWFSQGFSSRAEPLGIAGLTPTQIPRRSDPQVGENSCSFLR
jgi:hypothetical protein